MIVRELITKLGFNLDERPLQQAERGIRSLKSSALALTATVTAIGGGIFALVKSAANAGNSLVKTSQRVGIGVEALQKLQYAAQLADLSNDEFTLGLQLFSRRVVDAADGSNDAAQSFVRLGVKLKDNQGKIKTTESLLLELSDRFKKIPDGARKTALSMDLFGRSGARMIPFLNAGAAEIKGLGKELEDFGLIMGEDTAKAGEKFNDSLTKIRVILAGIKNIVGAKLLPLFLQLTQRFIEWLKVNREIVKQRLTDTINALVTALKTLVSIGGVVFGVLEKVSSALGGTERTTKLFLATLGLIYASRVIVGLVSLTRAIWGVAGALAGVQLSAIAIPAAIIAAVLAAIAWIYLIYDDLKAFFQGRKSIAGLFYQAGQAIGRWAKEVYEAVKDVLGGIIDIVQFIVNFLVSAFIDPLDTLQKLFSGAFQNIAKEMVDHLKEAVTHLLNLLNIPNQIVAKFLGIDKVAEKLKGIFQSDKTISPQTKTPSMPASPMPSREESHQNLVPLNSHAKSGTSLTPLFSLPFDFKQATENVRAINQPSSSPLFPSFQKPNVTQQNTFHYDQKIEIKVETNASPQQIGEKVQKATQDELDRHLRLTLRALQTGVV